MESGTYFTKTYKFRFICVPFSKTDQTKAVAMDDILSFVSD